jgi:hypothetical protein
MTRVFVSQLSARGVDCSLLQRFEKVPMGSCAVLSSKTDRAFVSCLGANHHLGVDALKQPSLYRSLQSCQHVHISGYFSLPLLQNSAMTELCRSLRSNGVLVSLDTQDDGPNSWLGRGGHLRELLGEVCEPALICLLAGNLNLISFRLRLHCRLICSCRTRTKQSALRAHFAAPRHHHRCRFRPPVRVVCAQYPNLSPCLPKCCRAERCSC